MTPRPIAIVGAPSSIGIRPYDDSGETRHLDRAPGVLREMGVVHRLGAKDFGNVSPPSYRDFVRPPGKARNEVEVASYCKELAGQVAIPLQQSRFVVVLGGDCSIVLGDLMGAKAAVGSDVGLAYVDGHADFATPEESITGSVASMCLAQAVGRGDTPLAHLRGPLPLVNPRDVVLIGRRDAAQSWYGHDALASSQILDLPDSTLVEHGYKTAASPALERLAAPHLRGFWIHLDADVLNPEIMPAVDSPEPGGPLLEDMTELLGPLVCHPLALGLELTIYDPALDPSLEGARSLVTLLERLLIPQ
jgi:arginase